VTEIRGLHYEDEDVEKITVWTEFAAKMLDAGFDSANMRNVVGSLAEAAQARYPQLESGVPVALRQADSGPTRTWPKEITNRFIEVTGDVLFAASDGPLVAGNALQGAIDRLARKRGQERERHGNDA